MFWWAVTSVASSATRVLELFPQTFSRPWLRDVRASEILSRTVSRHDAESEATRTYLRRVREGMLRRSGSALLVRSAGTSSST